MSIMSNAAIIDIVAPGYGCSQATLAKITAYITQKGFTPRLPAGLCDANADPFSAHDAATRFAHLERALQAEDNSAIWCIKGGYGTSALMQPLLAMPKPAKHKWVVGFSDITILHLFLQQAWGWPSLHGPVLWQAVKETVDEASMDATLAFLRAPGPLSYPITCLSPSSPQCVQGPIIGGNLCLLQSTLATPLQCDVAGKILLIEEVDEAPYRLDRMLMHLLQTGLLNQAKAVLIGDITLENAKDAPLRDAAIARFVEACAVPVFAVESVGHGQCNQPVPLGVSAQLGGGQLMTEKPCIIT